MKKLMAVLMTLTLMAMFAVPAFAQGGGNARYTQRNRQYNQQRYNHYRDQQRDNRSFWQKHRDKLTVAAGTGGGALLGGLIGGKKGAIIGALAGGGGSALYTYKIRNKNNRRY